MNNLFSHIPPFLDHEQFSDIVKTEQVRIERIVSYGQSSPEQGWYDQKENEWVMVLTGFGIVEYDNGETFELKQGNYLTIPAQQKHRVKATSEKEPTVWLAVFYP
ncbi:cupin [Vibrio ponticus]|uniref:Cupin n=1 Tax=Vibrio ponticus TaxID=265668 RepID=A0ABX3FRR4_9VIBR|nr:cupin domain-containing protein [Vibrio ponticus]OLQ95707.1 cupin [Vibrio ponticus]